MYSKSTKMAAIISVSLAITFSTLFSPVTVRAQAVTNTVNLSIPVNILVFVPCANGGAGEFVILSGDLHILTHVTINSRDVTIKFHAQPQGISGIGLSTGDTYHATGVTQQTATFQNDGAPFEVTFVNNFRIIGEGPGNNFLVHQTFHVTFDNSGQMTSFQNNFSIRCK